MTNIFVGNLPFSATEDQIQAAFGAYGAVERVTIVRDRESGQSRGFAFVEMTNGGEAENAMKALNGSDLNGRTINVNEARPREQRSGGGGFAGNRSGGGERRGSGGGGFNRRREPRW